MLERWRGSSVLVRSITVGVVFAVVQLASWPFLQGGSLTGALVGALIAGVLFGTGTGLWMRRLDRRPAPAGLGTLEEPDRRAVLRAAWRGPRPRDERVRRAAVGLVEHRLGTAVRNRRWEVPVFVAFAVLEAGTALADGGWGWWLAVALFVAFALVAVLEPRRLRRRLARLDG
ncbi:hypothetical protein [Kineococcus rhizosphaerae]|uniref:Uncharacterized protein n=1 Tax=Kineococcus rhizosphaerae TaxID=559628 RepID=A0A2T0QYG4_9ACTN|nr:hypothetical protein [Kineococcus rhizosphaerae]PRY11413.1 hypothetical protein CLV37_11334 [Kineococcus rhizosphaerae]